MNNNIEHLLQNSSLNNLIQQNKDLDFILEHLKNEIPDLPSPEIINEYIKEKLDMQWDNITSKWIKHIYEQVSLLDVFPSEDKKNLESINIPSKSKTDSKSNKDIKQSIDVLNERLTQIEKKLNGLETHINSISNAPASNPAPLSIEDFTKIYADKKAKKSITLNTELKKKIDEYISKEYGIENNDSLIINIALLIALKNISEE